MAESKTIVVGYFLEDIAQEHFIKAIVERVATGQGLLSQTLLHDVRNATGGVSRVIWEFKSFLRDHARGHESAFDVLVVAIDGNCTGYLAKKQQLLHLKEQTGYGGLIVCAIPDPHVE